MADTLTGTYSIERLVHFNCAACNRWWSVGDAPLQKRVWFCPWCGLRQQVDLRATPLPDAMELPTHAAE